MHTTIIANGPAPEELPILSATASPEVKKAWRRMRAVALTSDQVVDVLERLREVEADNIRLGELLQHCHRHSTYPECGYRQMGSAQKALYDEITGRTVPETVPLRAPSAPSYAGEWRSCEFCTCRSNARERICCQSGREADRRSWDRAAR